MERSMSLALMVKNKYCFADGTCKKSSYKGELETQWERCDVIVLPWISSTMAPNLVTTIFYAPNAKYVWDDFKERFNKSNFTRIYQIWTEVVCLRQGRDSVTDYYTKIKNSWDEFDVLIPSPSCRCVEAKPYVEHLHQQRLLMFLMGLNESFSHVRSDILLKSDVPSVNQAYATVVQEKSQRQLGVVEANKEVLTMLAGRGQNFRGKRPTGTFQGPSCEVCDYKGHKTVDCYRLVGYPADFKSNKKTNQIGSSGYDQYQNQIQHGGYKPRGAQQGETSSFRSYANNAAAEQGQGHLLTEE
ncbi:uncharacterized protein LOC132642819 [Lycium barbarum]|uniref:uncharacterized protein LOC132642819 n=1 Tax=Lycium barbarum TaxID=112863 RepID=UPI00293E54EE|nr:uncharacterized protein LOC132642819 [Lycium barbarum]